MSKTTEKVIAISEEEMQPVLKTVNIKGKPYVTVDERLIYFRKHYKNYALETEVIEKTDNSILIKAVISDENSRVIATGLAEEEKNSSFINKTSYVENCETSAWGRALANFGIGINTGSVASAEEVQNAINNQNKKPVLPVKKMKDVIKKLQNNEITIETVQKHYTLTDVQLNTLKLC